MSTLKAVVFAQSGQTQEIVIKPSDRRFSAAEGEKQLELLEKFSNEFVVDLKPIESRIGKDLAVEIKNAKEEILPQVKFILVESLSTQDTASIKMEPADLEILYKKLPRHELISNGYLQIRKDLKLSTIHLSGGKKSVKRAKAMLEEYLEWRHNVVTKRIEIEAEYMKYVLGSSSENKDTVVNKCGRYVTVVEKPDENAIEISGIISQVEKAAKIFMEIYNDIQKNTTKCQITLNSYVYKFLQPELNELKKKHGTFNFVCRSSQVADAVELSWAAAAETNNTMSDYIRAFADDFTSQEVKCDYAILKTLVLLGEVEKMQTEFKCDLETCFAREIICVMGRKEAITYKALPYLEKKINVLRNSFTFHFIVIGLKQLKLAEECQLLNLEEVRKETSTVIWTDKSFPKTLSETHGIVENREKDLLVGISGKENKVALVVGKISNALEVILRYKSLLLPTTKDGLINFGCERLTGAETITEYAPDCFFSIKSKSGFETSFLKFRGSGDQIESLKNAYEKAEKNFKENFEEVELIYSGFEGKLILQIPSLFDGIKEKYFLSKLNCTNVSNKRNKKVSICLCGRKEDLQPAQDMINEKLTKMAKKGTFFALIPDVIAEKFNYIGEWVIRMIKNNYDNLIHITYPPNLKKKSRFTVEGPAAIAKTAAHVLDHLLDSEQEFYLDTIYLSPPVMKEVDRTCSKSIQALINNDSVHHKIVSKVDEGYLYLLGKKENLTSTRQLVEEHIKKHESNVENIIKVPSKFRYNFFSRDISGKTLIERLSKDFDGVKIRIDDDPQSKNILKVTMKCHQKTAESCEMKIQNLMKTWENTVERKEYVENSILSILLRDNRKRLTEKMKEYNVELMVSQRYFDFKRSIGDTSNMKSILIIRGSNSNVEAFCADLSNLEHERAKVTCSLKHQEIISNSKFSYFQILKSDYMVWLEFGIKKSPPEETIYVEGIRECVEKAVVYIAEITENIFIKSIEIPPSCYGKIIGKGGSLLKEFYERHKGVQVFIPHRNSIDNAVTVVGEEESCFSALEELKKFAMQPEQLNYKKIELDSRARRQLLHNKDQSISSLESKYGVKIHVAPDDVFFPNKNIFTLCIAGEDENVSRCTQHLTSQVCEILEPLDQKALYYMPTDQPYEFDQSKIINISKSLKKK